MKKLAAVVIAVAGIALAGCASQAPAPQSAPVVHHHVDNGKLGKLGNH